LFVEKEGFERLFKAAAIARRFDVAIMSTKGMSVTAARLLIDKLTRQGATDIGVARFRCGWVQQFGTLGIYQSPLRLREPRTACRDWAKAQ
jgi:hypothetical protein